MAIYIHPAILEKFNDKFNIPVLYAMLQLITFLCWAFSLEKKNIFLFSVFKKTREIYRYRGTTGLLFC